MSALNDRIYVPLIGVVSVLIPLVVAVLIFMPKLGDAGTNIYLLPLVNACINTTVTSLLIVGYVCIRQKNIRWHKMCMLSAFALSSLFLVIYITYHSLSTRTDYCAEGPVPPPVYYFVLLTHIVLAAVIVPLALFSIYRGLNMQVARHRKIAKWTLPIWLYVSVTGVLVYLFISPCYPV